jgi:hypothetical protein
MKYKKYKGGIVYIGEKKTKCNHKYEPFHRGFMVLRSARYKCVNCGKIKIY